MTRQWAPRGILLLTGVVAGLAMAGPGLASAQAPAPDSVVYRILPTSRFEVQTGKAGVFGFAGHSHVIRARAFTGSVQYRPSDPSASRLEMTIPADSLEVMTPSDTAEKRQVTEAMRTEVLHVDQYPEIRFIVTGATPTPKGARLAGELTLAGQTRPVPVDATVEVGSDTLRAQGKFSVNQTDFGIKPYSGGPGGTVKVANRVTFDFDAVGVREPAEASRSAAPEGGTTPVGPREGGP
jgi:polyisoprenoid-binding protein YceI